MHINIICHIDIYYKLVWNCQEKQQNILRESYTCPRLRSHIPSSAPGYTARYSIMNSYKHKLQAESLINT